MCHYGIPNDFRFVIRNENHTYAPVGIAWEYSMEKYVWFGHFGIASDLCFHFGISVDVKTPLSIAWENEHIQYA